MSQAHQDMDDMAEHAMARQVIDQRNLRIYGDAMHATTDPAIEPWHLPHFTRVATARMPKGCDYQGRWPQAAEAATEVGADQAEERDHHEGIGAIEWGFYCLIGAICLVTIAVRLPGWIA